MPQICSAFSTDSCQPQLGRQLLSFSSLWQRTRAGISPEKGFHLTSVPGLIILLSLSALARMVVNASHPCFARQIGLLAEEGQSGRKKWRQSLALCWYINPRLGTDETSSPRGKQQVPFTHLLSFSLSF